MSGRTYDDGQLVQEWDDDTRTYRWMDTDGAWQERPYDEVEAAPLAEADAADTRTAARESLLGKVDAALAADLAYLDSAAPILATERLARVEAQVGRLTRQAVALLRLVGARLDDTAGT